MKQALPLALALSSPALAQEELPEPFRYGAGLGFFLGLPMHEHHEDEDPHHDHLHAQLAFDAHGDAVALLGKGEEVFGWQASFGANFGLILDVSGLEVEIKPAGLHLDCNVDEPCRPAYSFESIVDAHHFGLGLVFAVGATGLTEMKIPLRYKSFFLSPYYHAHDDGEKDFGVQAGFHTALKGDFGIAPSISVQKDAIWISFKLSFGHFHPY